MRGWAPVRGSALARRLALEGAPLVRASPTSPSPHLLSPSPSPNLLSPYLPSPHLATEAAIRATAMEVVATGVTVRAAAAEVVATGMTVRAAAAEAVEARVGQVLPAKS